MVSQVLCRLVCDGFDDVVIPISSFSVQLQDGAISYIQVVIPGLNYADIIADRADGDVGLYYHTSGSDNEIGILPITDIRIDEGGKNQSITLQANA